MNTRTAIETFVVTTNENKIITNVETKKTKSISSVSTTAINNRYLQMNMLDRLQNSKKCKSCGGK